MDGELLFEPYPFQEHAGEWGRWQYQCDICGAYWVAARLCWQCQEYECSRCFCSTPELNIAHRLWLYECALAYFRSKM